MSSSSHRLLTRMSSATTMGSGPRIVNVNSRSLSLASVSSDGSAESHLVEQEDIIALTQDVRSFKEGLNRLRKVFQDKEAGGLEVLRVTSHERLSDVLKILRHMLEKYPALQSNDLVAAAGLLIKKVKEFDYEENTNLGAGARVVADQKDFFESLDGLALAFSSRVSEYLMGDLDSNMSLSSASSKTKSYENLLGDRPVVDSELIVGLGHPVEDEVLSPDKIDTLLMHHDCGVDLALQRAKIWSKYAKDVISYVEKRTGMQLDFAKNLTKLVQTCRPQLQEESYLPFQSIYCTALDNDLELCASMQTSCGLLQGYKFLEPLQSRRAEHEKVRKSLKDSWHKELKRMHDEVDKLRKARSSYIARHQDWERCRDAARIAEQGAEIGATGENKLDKRKKYEEEAGSKAVEAETNYRQCVEEANSRHRALLGVKSRILQQIRELLMQADQTMKAVTVSYFQQQHTLTAPCPVQFQTLCESSRLYEPGSQYMKFVKRLPLDTGTAGGRATDRDPFSFEPYTPGMENILQLEKQRKWSASLEVEERRSQVGAGVPVMSWSPSVGGGEVTSETESNHSLESRESVKSRDTSPSHSPIVSIKTFQHFGSEVEEVGEEPGKDGISKRHLSKAANSHKFRKIQKPSKCRECDSYVFLQGYECADCGLASHKKCLETLHLLCGPKRLLRKMTTFGVDLGHHLLQVGEENEIPPLVRKCVQVVDSRGTNVKGIYRVSGVKSKVEKLCQAFENGAELVDLTDVHPNVIANVLKLYMRQLPEPLLTFRLYSEFIRVGRSCPAPGTGQSTGDEKEAVHQLRQLIGQLPRHHRNTLAYLCHHLHRVAQHSDTNNMPATNLAIVFGPTLLKTSEGLASLSSLVDTVHQTRVVELLTTHAGAVFGPQIDTEGRLAVRRQTRSSETAQDRLEMGPVHGSFSDEDPEGENDPIPDFLRSDYSQKVKKSPMLNRASSPPVIIKSSLKNFSGLEGSAGRPLPGQDSVDGGGLTRPGRSSHSSTSSSTTPGHRLDPESPVTGLLSVSGDSEGELRVRDRTSASSSSVVSISEENKVKIQVPGLPMVSKTSTSSNSSREMADH